MVNKPLLRLCFSLGVPYMGAPVDWSFNHQRRTFPAPIRRWIPPNRPAQDDVPKFSQKRCAHAPQSTGSSTWFFLCFLENIYIYIQNLLLNLSWKIFLEMSEKIGKKRLMYLTCWISFSNILEVNKKNIKKLTILERGNPRRWGWRRSSKILMEPENTPLVETWNLKIHPCNRRNIYQTPWFWLHVSLPEGNASCFPSTALYECSVRVGLKLLFCNMDVYKYPRDPNNIDLLAVNPCYYG